MKQFEIKRFSFALDGDDDCISAEEVEAILNKFENRTGGHNMGFGVWKVREVKNENSLYI